MLCMLQTPADYDDDDDDDDFLSFATLSLSTTSRGSIIFGMRSLTKRNAVFDMYNPIHAAVCAPETR